MIFTRNQQKEVYDLLCAGNMSARQIAEATSTNRKFVENIRHRYVKAGKPILVPVTTTPEILENPTPEIQKTRHVRRALPFDESAVLALYKAGFRREKIVTMLGVSDPRVKEVIKKFKAEHPDFKSPKITARLERDKLICELRKAGNSYAKIAEKVGMSEPGVCAVCSKYGLTHAAKQARKDNGEIPVELLSPLLEYMRKFISAELAEKVQTLAKEIA